MIDNLTAQEVHEELIFAEGKISDSNHVDLNVWSKSKIEPIQWSSEQYEPNDKYWVVAILNGSCLYFNHIEDGWGWGKFKDAGHIDKYHWEQEEIHEAFLWRYKDQLNES